MDGLGKGMMSYTPRYRCWNYSEARFCCTAKGVWRRHCNCNRLYIFSDVKIARFASVPAAQFPLSFAPMCISALQTSSQTLYYRYGSSSRYYHNNASTRQFLHLICHATWSKIERQFILYRTLLNHARFDPKEKKHPDLELVEAVCCHNIRFFVQPAETRYPSLSCPYGKENFHKPRGWTGMGKSYQLNSQRVVNCTNFWFLVFSLERKQ